MQMNHFIFILKVKYFVAPDKTNLTLKFLALSFSRNHVSHKERSVLTLNSALAFKFMTNVGNRMFQSSNWGNI